MTLPRNAGEPRDIVFDLDDTLIYTAHKYYAALIVAAGIVHHSFGMRHVTHPMEFIGTAERINGEVIRAVGFRNGHMFVSSCAQAYEELCVKRGLLPQKDVAEAVTKAALGHRAGPFIPVDGAKRTLRALRRDGHRLHLVTMGEPGLQMERLHGSGLQEYFRAENIHVTDHDKRAAISRCIDGRDPARSVMVGDSLKSDITSAIDLGMVAMHVPGDPWSFAQADVPKHAFISLASIKDVPHAVRELP
ncbi:MAG: hypothetical protein RLZZ324_566 [Candidatus Parcubacteria bacterium]|jgi:FMN phosphatase YigB (HAD superfamily)